MALCCQFPFQGSSSPSSLVLGVHLLAIKSFFFAYCPPLALSPGKKGLLEALLSCAQQLHISILSSGAKAVPSTTAQQDLS